MRTSPSTPPRMTASSPRGRARDADRAPDRQPALWLLSRRALLHNLRLPSGLGIRRPAAGRAAPGGRVAALRTLALPTARDSRALRGGVGLHRRACWSSSWAAARSRKLFAALVAALTPVLMELRHEAHDRYRRPVAVAAGGALRLAHRQGRRPALVAGCRPRPRHRPREQVQHRIFFAVGIVVALLLVPQRRALFTPWFLAGCSSPPHSPLPNFVWQAAHGYPMWTLLLDAASIRTTLLTPLQYVATQLLITHPLLAPVWIVGLVALLRRPDARFLGLAYLVLIAQMIALHGKHYYPATSIRSRSPPAPWRSRPGRNAPPFGVARSPLTRSSRGSCSFRCSCRCCRNARCPPTTASRKALRRAR